MAAQRPKAAPNARAARASGVAFAGGGSVLVTAGVVSILVGWPSAAHDLVPLAGPADFAGRFGQVAPAVSAAVAGIVVAVVAWLLATRRLEPVAAAMELLVLGLVIEFSIVGAIGRIGHAADGGVMGATVACLMGGTAVIAGGIIAVLGHE